MLFQLTLKDSPTEAGYLGFREVWIWFRYLEADESSKASQKELFESVGSFAAADSRERQNPSLKGPHVKAP